MSEQGTSGNGGSSEIIALLQQIADLKQKNHALQQELELFRQRIATDKLFRHFTDCSTQGLGMGRLDGRIVYANQALCGILGLEKPEDALDTLIPDYYLEEDRMRLTQEILPRVLEKGMCTVEMPLVSVDGRVTPTIQAIFLLRNEEKEPEYFANVISDISERLKLERQLQIQQNKKIESLGILAGGIAHDFNNMLAAIMGNASLALHDLEAGHRAAEKIRDIEKASEMARGLTKQLLTFSKGGLPIKESTSIGDLIKETACFMLRGSNITCNCKNEEGLWAVDIDKGQISQVIQNLVLNSIQAMPDGGEFIIRAENYHLDRATPLPLPEGRYVKILVSDQGGGIPQNELPKVFDPYFSTKPQGTGLGLAIVHSIIRKHKGHITVESEVGKGTTFTLYIPTTVEKKKVYTLSSNADIRAGGRILIMDDDDSIRQMLASMLELMHFEVTAVRCGREAIARYEMSMKDNNKFAAVILDLTVPGGMGGEEAMKKLLQIDAGIRAFVSSGYADGSIMAECRTKGFIGAIPKPYNMQELKRALARLSGDDIA